MIWPGPGGDYGHSLVRTWMGQPPSRAVPVSEHVSARIMRGMSRSTVDPRDRAGSRPYVGVVRGGSKPGMP